MSRENQLWMGSLQPHMNRTFIRNAFSQMGEKISGVIMANPKSGKPESYCFVQFPDIYYALLALHKLNDKEFIPGSQPPVKFQLNHASLAGKHAMKTDYSLMVNLSLEVDDCTLFKGFFERYPSVRRAQVVTDEFGTSRGYGFVRFADEEEQRKALIEMEGFKGIGTNFLHVKMGHSKEKFQKTNKNSSLNEAMAVIQAAWSGQPQATTSATTAQPDYSQYYWQYWNYYASSAQWPNYGNYSNTAYPTYDYAQQQLTFQQPSMLPETYQAAAQPAPMDIPMERRRNASHLDEQQDDDTKPAENDGPVQKKTK